VQQFSVPDTPSQFPPARYWSTSEYSYVKCVSMPRDGRLKLPGRPLEGLLRCCRSLAPQPLRPHRPPVGPTQGSSFVIYVKKVRIKRIHSVHRPRNSLPTTTHTSTASTMCGITAVLRVAEEQVRELRPVVLQMSKRQRHRGPDWSGIHLTKSALLAHERLGIMDPESGHQPLVSKDKQIILTVNGEIFNYKEVRAATEAEYEYQVRSPPRYPCLPAAGRYCE
jgi:hypothetical protein